MRQYYDQYKYEIEAEYSELGEGESRSGQVCPACKGGSSEETSLSVSRRDGLLLFNCFRSSCGFRGAIGISTAGGEKSSKSSSVRSRTCIPSMQLDQATAKLLASKYGISRETIRVAGLRWTGEGTSNYARRVSFPIFGPDSRERGTSYRSYEGKQPKALIRFTSDDAVALSWYKFQRTSRLLVLVEDQVSAMKIAPFYHSAALLGTNLAENKVDEILAQNPKYDRIYLSLDSDAVYEAIKTQLYWRSRVPNLLVLGIQKDIKNMNDTEFKEYLERLS